MISTLVAALLLYETPTELTGHCGAFVDGVAYVGGGSPFANIGRFYSEVWKVDLATNRWTKFGDLHTPRGMAAMAYLDGSLYVAGGCSFPGEQLNSVERFDLKTSNWAEVAPMLSRRSRFSLVAIRGKLFAVGGLVGQEGELNTRDVEQYDPAANRWSLAGRTLEPRHGYGAAALGSKIYIFGGYADADTASCEVFDTSTGKSRELPPMPGPRGFHSAVVVGEKIVCFGGRPARIHPSTFDPKTSKWSDAAGSDVDICRTVTAYSAGKLWVIGGENGANQRLPLLRRIDVPSWP